LHLLPAQEDRGRRPAAAHPHRARRRLPHQAGDMTDATERIRARPRWSIRRRVVLGVVALVALLGVLIGAVSVLALRQNLLQRLDSQVYDVSRYLLAGQPGDELPGGNDSLSAGLVVAVLSAGDGARGYVYTDPGSAEALTRTQLRQLFTAPSDGASTVHLSGLGNYRVEVHTAANGALAVGISTAEVD